MKTLLGITRKPDLVVHRDGMIEIKSRLVKQLAMREGDIIDVMVDKGEFYLFVRIHNDDVVGNHCGRVRSSNKYKYFSHNFRAQSRKLADAIIEAAGWTEDKPLRLAAGECEAFDEIGLAAPLITKRPL